MCTECRLSIQQCFAHWILQRVLLLCSSCAQHSPRHYWSTPAVGCCPRLTSRARVTQHRHASQPTADHLTLLIQRVDRGVCVEQWRLVSHLGNSHLLSGQHAPALILMHRSSPHNTQQRRNVRSTFWVPGAVAGQTVPGARMLVWPRLAGAARQSPELMLMHAVWRCGPTNYAN